MSIYSGFATRQQQQTYDHCINSLLYILQKRILKFYNQQKTDQQKFTNLLQKIYLQIKTMEKFKYLDPKCSYAIQQLFAYLIKQNLTQQNPTAQEKSTIAQKQELQINSGNKGRKNTNKKGSNLNTSNNHERNMQIMQSQLINQKHYQVPIRTAKYSPNRKVVVGNSKSSSKNIGKIVSANNSKLKLNSSTIDISSNIRQRTPSLTHGQKFSIRKPIISQVQDSQNRKVSQSSFKARNRSFNSQINNNNTVQNFTIDHKIPTPNLNYTSNQSKYLPSYKKKSSRTKIPNLNSDNQVLQIIQGYIQKNKRIQSGQSRKNVYSSYNYQNQNF